MKGDKGLVRDLGARIDELQDSTNVAWLLAAKADDENGRIQQRLADLEDLTDELLSQQAKLMAALINGLEVLAEAENFPELKVGFADLIAAIEGNPPPPSA